MLLNSLDAIMNELKALPEFEDPKLRPIGDTLDAQRGRKYWKMKEEENKFNAWSHRVSHLLKAEQGREAATFLTVATRS